MRSNLGEAAEDLLAVKKKDINNMLHNKKVKANEEMEEVEETTKNEDNMDLLNEVGMNEIVHELAIQAKLGKEEDDREFHEDQENIVTFEREKNKLVPNFILGYI